MAEDTVLQAILDRDRKELLDLSARNRLINTSRTTTRSSRVEIVNERSVEVFRRLVVDGKSMGFSPTRSQSCHVTDVLHTGDSQDNANEHAGESELQAGDSPSDDNSIRAHDDKLQTQLTSNALQKRLLKLYYDARTFQEEQGINILYLALGFLKWYEDDKSNQERFAPLLMLPVALDRKSAGSRFKVSYTGEEIGTNLSLQERLKSDFAITLPTIPEGEDFSAEEFSANDYFAAVTKATCMQQRWQVLPDDVVLWFFSFSKLLMHRDLKPASWPKGKGIEDNGIIRSLLRDGFRGDPPLCGKDDKIDPLIPSLEMVHVLDADSSQAIAIEEVKRGHSLVIQGPPGTGKSQTIANVIASSVKAGKSVLFVAEKMAALEVVKSRLAELDLGDMCLELHSNKANKKAVLADLESTLRRGEPHSKNVQEHCKKLDRCRDQLNIYVDVIHAAMTPCERSPYQVIGELVRLGAAGTRPPDFRLDGGLEWTRTHFEARRDLLDELVRRLKDVGVPGDHPWRGVELDSILPTERDRIIDQLPGISARVGRLLDAGDRLASALDLPVPADVIETWNLSNLALHLAKSPPMDRSCLASRIWTERRSEIDGIVSTGKRYAERQQQLNGLIVEGQWSTDVTVARRNLAAYGRSWLRFLRGSYRSAQRFLRDVLADSPVLGPNDRLAILDRLIEWQKARDFLADGSGSKLGAMAFGSLWQGVQSDWNSLAAITEWEAKCREAKISTDFRVVCSRLRDLSDLRAPVKQIADDINATVAALKGLFQLLRFNLECAFLHSDLRHIPLTALADRLREWQADPEALSRWVQYKQCRGKVDSSGLAAITSKIEAGQLASSDAIAQFEMAYYEALIGHAYSQHRQLNDFRGDSHEQLLDRFRRLDLRRIELARSEVALAHYRRLEPLQGFNSGVGEVGVIRQEIKKSRRHLPIRKLLVNAGQAVMAIKPVFMMSPLSVAQFLQPGVLEFDVLLIDEASQVRPVDAYGAIARSRQIVVVGDERQLPPTQFFEHMTGDDGSDEDEQFDSSARDVESILGLCSARGLPERMLNWHYRSRHHSLIAVSNHEFYDDRLFVVRSPGPRGTKAGLQFQHIENGVYDRGGTATNRNEASVVAEAVIEHARQFPDMTLGVGSFSVAQRDAILNELELLRRADPTLEPFFVHGKAEPFFVKNLENIQGDERDVIFISVGYGKDKDGHMSQSFGPLQIQDGQRRLNVLITRAKQCCRVFSSIYADDIDLDRARSRGAQALKTYLLYAQRGLLDTRTPSGRDHDSEFERQVAEALAKHGVRTEPQIGEAGFFIDLAVVDEEHPGRYLLGIECDGAQYHRSRSARDRDRLREKVLCDRGWLIHRIWSTDWFHRPKEQLDKTLAAVEEARKEWRRIDEGEPTQLANGGSNKARTDAPTEIERHECNGNGCGEDTRIHTEEYRVASFRIPANLAALEIHEVSTDELARIVARVIDIEGPIHRDEVARRVTELWGRRRTGKRISECVNDALHVACSELRVPADGEFYFSRSDADVRIRDRSETTVQHPDLIPPIEIRMAVTAVIEAGIGVTRDEAVSQSVQLFGFNRAGSKLRQVIEKEIECMLMAELLDERNEKLYLPQSQPE